MAQQEIGWLASEYRGRITDEILDAWNQRAESIGQTAALTDTLQELGLWRVSTPTPIDGLSDYSLPRRRAAPRRQPTSGGYNLTFISWTMALCRDIGALRADGPTELPTGPYRPRWLAFLYRCRCGDRWGASALPDCRGGSANGPDAHRLPPLRKDGPMVRYYGNGRSHCIVSLPPLGCGRLGQHRSRLRNEFGPYGF